VLGVFGVGGVPASLDLMNARSCEFVSNLGEHFKGVTRANVTHFNLPKGQFYGYLNCNGVAR